MITHIDIPSSSSPPTLGWTYDVFLSFRGEDTRRNFTDCLYTSLTQKGVNTFRDDERLERGKTIAPELLKAIEESRYVIVILSSNYANSTWCLDELAKAVECMNTTGQTILPVFYHVDPSDVRTQRAGFGEAFSKHEEAFKHNKEKVKRWRDALADVANLSGWHLQDEYESKVIQDIVGKILRNLYQTTSSVSPDFVGMDSRVKDMLSYLDMGLHEVCVVGILGIGGIGKTSIARVVYERLRAKFEAYSFLANVREVTEKRSLVDLQNQLLSDILLESNLKVHNIEMGISLISQRLRKKRVLIILDDVDTLEQLGALCDCSWFGSGSRIIITSRDERLLKTFGVKKRYKVKELNDSEALKLFSWKAFKNHQVGEGFLELSKNVVEYASGLPLALTVLGSLLFGRSYTEWSSALGRLKENPQKGIIDVLKVSFDTLESTEKKVFLDIACFFKGEDRDRVVRILESGLGYSPDIDIGVLMGKSLITLFGKKLCMHDLIQELGWEIVRRECREDPGKRSRLWLPKDIIPVLVKDKGSDAIEGIFLNLPKSEEVHLNHDSFSKMTKLRLLKICNVTSSGTAEYLSNDLQLLEWHACPLNSLPPNFQSDKLVEVIMHGSCLKQLWNGTESWSMLKFIDLSDSQYLSKTPNFSKAPNIVELVLQGCSKLVDVHSSMGVLEKLVLLNMRNCKSLKSLPSSISMESLKILTLSGCSRLKKFPEIKGNMKSLLELHLDGTAIEELPPSIEHLACLTLLNLGECKNLSYLPSTIQKLTSLKTLILTGCSELNDIPESLNCVEGLEELDISGTAIRESSFVVGMKNLKSLSFRGCKDMPSRSWHSLFNCWWWSRRGHVPLSLLLPTSFSGLSSLTILNLSGCNLVDGDIPNDLGLLFSLKTLDLSENNFVCLPESICQLSKLESLNVSKCSRLQLLPKKLPLSVQHVNAKDSTSLIDFPNQFKMFFSSVSGTTTINSLSSKFQGTYTIGRRFLSLWASSDASRNAIASPEKQESKPVDDFSVQTQFVREQLELLDYRSTRLQSMRPQTEIPEWFSHTATEYSIAIPLSPDLNDDRKWMGVALCAVFSVKGHLSVSRIESDSTTSYIYQCKLRSRQFEREPFILDSEVLRSCGSHHFVSVFYVPCKCFPKTVYESSVISAFFETNNPCIEVQKCGVRLVYEQDVAGFVETFLPCGTGRNQHQLVPSDSCDLNKVDEVASKSGWLSIVDNVLRWEKLIIPTYEEGSIILLKRNIESLLPRYLERLNHKCQLYDFGISGIPAWFNPQVGCSMSIELPKNLHKSKKWMGFVLCTSLAVEQSKVGGRYDLACEISSSSFDGNLSLRSFNVMDKHQLWVIYIPRAKFRQQLIRSSSSSIVSSLFTTGNPGVEVQITGFRILYQQDLRGFVQTITQSILRGSSIFYEYYNDFVVKNWIKLIKLQALDEVDLEPIMEYDSYPEMISNQLTEGRESDFSTPRETYNQIYHDLRQRDWSVAELTCGLPGIEIPKWFMNSSEGNSAEIQLPQNLYNDGNWRGIAVCAYLSFHEHPTIILDIPDSDFTRVLICHLDTNVASVNFHRVEHTNKHMWLHACDLIWFLYIPRLLFSTSLNQCDLVTATFGSNSFGLGVRECALRLVYKEDMEELIQTLILSKLSAKCHQCELAKHGNSHI